MYKILLSKPWKPGGVELRAFNGKTQKILKRTRDP
jgi:hypothetical protein